MSIYCATANDHEAIIADSPFFSVNNHASRVVGLPSHPLLFHRRTLFREVPEARAAKWPPPPPHILTALYYMAQPEPGQRHTLHNGLWTYILKEGKKLGPINRLSTACTPTAT
jgi:hypothetical protein